MSDKLSDYQKIRTKLQELLPTHVRNDVIDNILENVTNRFFTKEDNKRVVGSLGLTDDPLSLPQIKESSIHRQAFQLQPLAYVQTGAEKHHLSFKDVLRKLENLGIDTSRLNEWANTEQFNFAPPVDPDKIINFSNYYWYDPSGQTSPNYITIKNMCTVANARVQQKQSEYDSLGTPQIQAIESTAIFVPNNVTSVFSPGAVVDIINSDGNDGVYTIVESSFEQGISKLVLDRSLPNPTATFFGQISMDALLQQSIQERNLVCNNAIGWDSTSWDNSEQGAFWDGGNTQGFSNDWSDNNFWIHQLDLEPSNYGLATRATMPIIEFLPSIELNSQITRGSIWSKRNPSNNEWNEVDSRPEYDDIYDTNGNIKSSFLDNWAFKQFTSYVPTAKEEDVTPVVITTATSDPEFKLQANSTFSLFTLPNTQRAKLLKSSSLIRVYVNGKRAYSSYYELTETSQLQWTVDTGGQVSASAVTVYGIGFVDPLTANDLVEVVVSPISSDDLFFSLLPVRVGTGSNYSVVVEDLTETFKTEQVVSESGQYPLFNLYDIFGNFHSTSPIFTFKTNKDFPVNTLVNKRVEYISNQRQPIFEQHLQRDGHLLCYKDLEQPANLQLQTIWRTSLPSPHMYVPAKVNERGEIPKNNEPADWEVVDQYIYNPTHRLEAEISYTDLVSHFLSIVNNQKLPPGFTGSPTFSARLFYNIDYGLGGTIKEHNHVFDLLVSSLFTNISDPPRVMSFAGSQYTELQTNVQQLVSDGVLDFLLNLDTSFDSAAIVFADAVKTSFESNDTLSKVFGDSGSYNEVTGTGIRNWIATLPMLGIMDPVQPLIISDPNQQSKKLLHHDGHLGTPTFNQLTERNIYSTLLHTQRSSGRWYGWSPQQAADNGSVVSHYNLISLNRLVPHDYWIDSNLLYVFDAISTSNATPSTVAYPVGSYWVRSDDSQVFVLNEINGNLEWVPTTAHYTDLWKRISINDIFINTLLQIEQDLYEVTLEFANLNSERPFDSNNYVITTNDELSYTAFLNQSFLEFARQRDIINPYQVDFDYHNPYTWNYSDIDITIPSVRFPYAKDESLWSARWYTIYKNVFGTSYPNQEPWVLQGYSSKPEWWDEEYRDATGTRTWKSQMWTNIKSGIIPAGKTAPPFPPRLYDFVCVNTTDETTYDGIGPDQLIPPFWMPPNSSPLSVADAAAALETFIVDQFVVDSVNLDKGYEFGDIGPVERLWRESTQFLYDQLIAYFKLQPVRFLSDTWGYDYTSIGHLLIDKNTQQVPSHNTTIFHGEVTNSGAFKSKGINQWFINYNRFNDYDNVISNFESKWKNWKPRWSYQTDSFIDQKNLVLATNDFQFTSEDINVDVKKSNGIDILDIPSWHFKISKIGSYRFRNDQRVPKEDGSDWEFLVEEVLGWNTSLTYYPCKSSIVKSVDVGNGEFVFERPHFWETGDVVDITSFDLVPRPLEQDVQYFAIKRSSTSIAVARTRTDAIQNNNIQLVDDGGRKPIWAQTPTSTFRVHGGINTPVEWKVCEVVKQPITENFPINVTGVQGLINLFIGAMSFNADRGIVPNPDHDVIDPLTGKVQSTITELQRAIFLIYEGFGLNNPLRLTDGVARQCQADPVANTIKVMGSFEGQTGTEVYFYTPGILPSGLVETQPYYLIKTQAENVFRVANNVTNAENGVFVNFHTNGASNLYISSLKQNNREAIEWIEFNPFRNSLMIPTPKGVLANVITGSYNNLQSDQTLQDENGNKLTESDIFVFRYDKGSKLSIPSPTEDIYANKHYGSGRFYVDGYEHVIVFADYTSRGNLIYDSFLGLFLSRIDTVIASMQNEAFRRPSVGGYFLTDGKLIPNFEKQTVDMHTMYDQFSETEYEEFSKRLLGYDDPEFLSELNVHDKSRFLFWKGMIQAKGSRQSIDAFINSKQFVDAKVDEFWAYKEAEYGSSASSYVANFYVNPKDVIGSDIWVNSGSVNSTPKDFNSNEGSPIPAVCDYPLDQDELSEYSNLYGSGQFQLGTNQPLSTMLPQSSSLMVFDIEQTVGSNRFVQTSSILTNQVNDNSYLIGDFKTTSFNRYGFQLTIVDLIGSDDSPNDTEFNVNLIGVANGTGNLLRVQVQWDGTLKQKFVNLQQRIENGNWEWNTIHSESVDVDFEIIELGVYWDRTLNEVGVVINDINLGFISGSYSTGTLFDNVGIVLELVSDVDSTSPIISPTTTVELTVDPAFFTVGFPTDENINAICLESNEATGCAYPLISSITPQVDSLSKYKNLFPERVDSSAVIQDLNLNPNVPDSQMSLEYTVSETTEQIYNFATTETVENLMINNNSRYLVSGDSNTDTLNFIGFGVKFNNVVTSQLVNDGFIKAGFLIRSANVENNVGYESFLDVSIGEVKDGASVQNAVVLKYGNSSSNGSVDVSFEQVFPVSFTELFESEIKIYIDINENKIGWVANGVDNGYLKDLNTTLDFVFDSRTFGLFYVEPYVTTKEIGSSDPNLGNKIQMQLDTSVSTFALPGIQPICYNLIDPSPIIDPTTNYYLFGWGQTTENEDDNVTTIVSFGNNLNSAEIL